MKITRIYNTENNTSAFEDFELDFISDGDIGKLTEKINAKGIIFRETDGDYDYDWHNAPAKQFVIMQEGEVDITVGDGTTRRFTTGDVILAEDTEGQGHISRAVEGRKRKSIFVILED
jgi:uncharacterized protein YjlB